MIHTELYGWACNAPLAVAAHKSLLDAQETTPDHYLSWFAVYRRAEICDYEGFGALVAKAAHIIEELDPTLKELDLTP